MGQFLGILGTQIIIIYCVPLLFYEDEARHTREFSKFTPEFVLSGHTFSVNRDTYSARSEMNSQHVRQELSNLALRFITIQMFIPVLMGSCIL